MSLCLSESQEIRHNFSGDRYRPSYHFLAPSNYMGDPNGTIYWNGRYHLFYQYNPDGAYDDAKRMHWGHASSVDLLHWSDHPIALSPTPCGPDRLGCYSGAAFDMDGVPSLIYYGNPGGICIVIGDDDLVEWRQNTSNPVIHKPSEGEVEWDTWDPCAWKYGDDWYLLSGGSSEGKDTAFLFRSQNLEKWEYVGMFYEPGDESDCSVPDFFRIEDTHMLLFASHEKGVQYYIGDYDGEKFYPIHHGRMNFGSFTLESGHMCAGLTLKTPDDRRIMFGWVTEGRKEEVQEKSGWSGVMSLPRELSLFKDGTLMVKPLRELEVLRNRHRKLGSRKLPAESRILADTIRSGALEANIRLDIGDAITVGLEVFASPAGEERTVIKYSRQNGKICLDPKFSSVSEEMVGRDMQEDILSFGEKGVLNLHVFLDKSIVEVFANDKVCLTKRVYPSLDSSVGIYLFSSGGNAKLLSFDAWDIGSVW